MLGVILSRTKSFIEVQMQEDRNIDFSSFKVSKLRLFKQFFI